MWICASQIILLFRVREPFRLCLIHDFMIEFRNVAEVLGRLEDVTRLVEVAAHARRTVVAVGTMEALRKVLSADSADAFRLRRLSPNPIEVMLIAAAEIDARKSCARKIEASCI